MSADRFDLVGMSAELSYVGPYGPRPLSLLRNVRVQRGVYARSHTGNMGTVANGLKGRRVCSCRDYLSHVPPAQVLLLGLNLETVGSCNKNTEYETQAGSKTTKSGRADADIKCFSRADSI